MSEPNLKSADGKHAIYFKSSTSMEEIADASVQLVVTSPPYYLGRDYGDNPEQLERETISLPDYYEWLHSLEPVWNECYRVLEPGGYACLNIAPVNVPSRIFGENFQLPIPSDVAQYWIRTLGAINKTRHIWLAVRPKWNAKREDTVILGSYPHPLEGCVMRDIEEILVLRKPKLPGQKLSDERKMRWKESALTKEEWREYFAQVWLFPGARKETAGGVVHPAPFPLELPHRCVKMYSVVGDTVLDPFLGTGTTTLAAMKNHRYSVGYEVERQFEPHILAKTHIGENSLEAVM